jgi:hypothetical protein
VRQIIEKCHEFNIEMQQEVYSKSHVYSYVTVGDVTASDFVLQNELLEIVSRYIYSVTKKKKIS